MHGAATPRRKEQRNTVTSCTRPRREHTYAYKQINENAACKAAETNLHQYVLFLFSKKCYSVLKITETQNTCSVALFTKTNKYFRNYERKKHVVWTMKKRVCYLSYLYI